MHLFVLIENEGFDPVLVLQFDVSVWAESLRKVL